MVVFSAARIAALPPGTDVAMFDRFRVRDTARVVRDERFELAADSPVIRGKVRGSQPFHPQRLVHGSDPEPLGSDSLNPLELRPVDGELEDRPDAQLTRELRVDHLVGKGSEPTRRAGAQEKIRASLPASVEQHGLIDERCAGSHRRGRVLCRLLE
jgi:hypothetical protein